MTKHKSANASLLLILALALLWPAALAYGDYETDFFGYYYVISGGALGSDFPPGGDPVVQFDGASWSSAGGPLDHIAGLALTMYGPDDAVVYDNSGLHTPGNQTVTDFYKTRPGRTVSYSMSNNFNWITAGYFHLDSEILVTRIVGYFDEWGISPDYPDFLQDAPGVTYRVNLYSRNPATGLPGVNDFSGNIFCSDTVAGTFTWGPTGYSRLNEYNDPHSIYSLVYTPETPLTLPAGDYFFAHDAEIYVPEPGSAGLLLALAAPALLLRQRRRPSC